MHKELKRDQDLLGADVKVIDVPRHARPALDPAVIAKGEGFNNLHPLAQALASMNRAQKRAFASELRRLKRREVPGGLKTAWEAAQKRGWRGTIPTNTVAG